MQYPLREKIGRPELFVGREQEFELLNHWLAKIPKELGKSKAILARRKSGKTCIVQRIFNRLWSENGPVIPFYFVFEESKIWHPHLALKYYRTFASQYLSFLERDAKLVSQPLTLEEIRQYAVTKQHPLLVRDIDLLFQDKERGLHDSMWDTAVSAPHRFAAYFDLRWLVILDEFQYITRYVYPDPHYQTSPIDTLAGTYHNHAESKVAPMLVTSSYPSWLMDILAHYLEAGRIQPMDLSPYLSPTAGLEAVYRYAHLLEVEITDDTALLINKLCFSDPFFISCVIESNFPGKDLTTQNGVIDIVTHEISYRNSQMSKTWEEYLLLTLQQVNDRYAKSLLLFLHKHPDRYWTPRELKEKLQIADLSVSDIQKRLLALSKADVIEQGNSNIQFRGLQDGTLHLIIRNRLEEEINDFVLDLKQEFHDKLATLETETQSLRGQLNQLKGRVAEYRLAKAFRQRSRLALTAFFQNVQDPAELHLTRVQEQVRFQREDGKEFEIDVVAHSTCGRVVLVEVKKTQEKMGVAVLETFLEKVQVYQQTHPEARVVPAFLSLGGFTKDAKTFGEAQGIAMAEHLVVD